MAGGLTENRDLERPHSKWSPVFRVARRPLARSLTLSIYRTRGFPHEPLPAYVIFNPVQDMHTRKYEDRFRLVGWREATKKQGCFVV
jgi:hypothetical protein